MKNMLKFRCKFCENLSEKMYVLNPSSGDSCTERLTPPKRVDDLVSATPRPEARLRSQPCFEMVNEFHIVICTKR